jgi:hypothetical protein
MTSTGLPDAAAPVDLDLLDRYLPVYDLAITEHVVVEADAASTYRAARDLDFLTVRTPLLSASFFVRGLPARLRGRPVESPPELRLAAGGPGLPGWLVLGEVPGREVAFGAVGRFWKPDIEWRDVPREHFAAFADPGWGKIGCHFLVRPDGPGRSVLSYECRTATTDAASRQQMARYWWAIRPFVAHVLRATIRTIQAEAQRTG